MTKPITAADRRGKRKTTTKSDAKRDRAYRSAVSLSVALCIAGQSAEIMRHAMLAGFETENAHLRSSYQKLEEWIRAARVELRKREAAAGRLP